MAKFIDAKYRLMPYLYQLVGDLVPYDRLLGSFTEALLQALMANSHGYPVQRAMFLEFPDDRTTHYLDRQYMLGSNLLVAPVFVPTGEKSEYYLPAGRWTSFFHPKKTLSGPIWVNEVVPIDEIPVWVRPGSVLCLGHSGIRKPDYDVEKELEVQVYEPAGEQTVEIPTGKLTTIGGIIKVEKRDQEVSIRVVSGTATVSMVTIFSGSEVRRVAVDNGKDVVVAG